MGFFYKKIIATQKFCSLLQDYTSTYFETACNHFFDTQAYALFLANNNDDPKCPNCTTTIKSSAAEHKHTPDFAYKNIMDPHLFSALLTYLPHLISQTILKKTEEKFQNVTEVSLLLDKLSIQITQHISTIERSQGRKVGKIERKILSQCALDHFFSSYIEAMVTNTETIMQKHLTEQYPNSLPPFEKTVIISEISRQIQQDLKDFLDFKFF